MYARDNHGNAYSGAAISLELSHQNNWVTVKNHETTGSTTYSDSSGYARLWTSSGGGDPSIGFRAVATGGGRTVRSDYTYVTFSAGDWVATFGSSLHGSGSGSATNSNFGTSSDTFWVCGTAVSGTLQRDGWNYLELSCEADASRAQSDDAQAHADVEGSGGGQFYNDVVWEPDGNSAYLAPPGFSACEGASADAYAGHWGVSGRSVGWGGPDEDAHALADDDDGSVWDSWPILIGPYVACGSSSARAQIGVSAYVSSVASPGQRVAVDSSAWGRQDDLGSALSHNPILDGYPAP